MTQELEREAFEKVATKLGMSPQFHHPCNGDFYQHIEIDRAYRIWQAAKADSATWLDKTAAMADSQKVCDQAEQIATLTTQLDEARKASACKHQWHHTNARGTFCIVCGEPITPSPTALVSGEERKL